MGTMSYDDEYNRNRSAIKMNSKGMAQVEATSENLVKTDQHYVEQKDISSQPNYEKTNAQVVAQLVDLTDQLNMQHVQCTHQSDEDYQKACERLGVVLTA